jgi:hypothetical protein
MLFRCKDKELVPFLQGLTHFSPQMMHILPHFNEKACTFAARNIDELLITFFKQTTQ